jgi:hypothetical protein
MNKPNSSVFLWFWWIHFWDSQVDDILTKEAYQYLLPLPKRDYIVSNKWQLYINTRGHNIPRIIDRVKIKTDIHNSLERELTVRIKWGKDSFLASDQSIGRFKELLLKVAWDDESRDFLKWILKKYESIINWKFSPDQITPQIELQAKVFYFDCIEWLNLTWEDEETIKYFSWEWKTTFRHCPFYCRAWIVVVCILQMIDLDKQ